MKKQGKRSILLCFSIMLLTVDMSMSLHSSWNWFEAQQHCSNINDTLKIKNSSTANQHWTGFYRRISPWIKYLGCYDSKSVDEHQTYNFHMNFTSAGFCREICKSVNSTLFGIKLKECVCLKFTISSEIILSNKCTNKCIDVEEDGGIKFLECGGPYAYSLFKSVLIEDDDVGRGTACLAIDCGPVKKFTISVDCSESYFGICAYKGYLGCFKDQENRTLTGKSINMNTMTLEICKKFCNGSKYYGVEYSKECFCGNFLSISIREPEKDCNMGCEGDKSQICGGDWRISIYNNLNYRTIRETNWAESMKSCKNWYPPSDLIRNATFACDRLQMTKNGLFWLSIAKEIYTGYDRGVAVDADDKASFLQCQKCNKTDCEFIDCLQRMNYSICEKASAIETIQRRAGFSDSNINLRVIIPLSLGILILFGCFATGIVCYKRQKANQKNEKTVPNLPNLNENYYVNETHAAGMYHSSRKLESENTKQDIDDTYQESAERVYDHLRDVRTRKCKTEDVYDHVPVVTEQEYAFGGHAVNTAGRLESTYDHTVSISDYRPNNKVVNKMDDDYSQVHHII